MDHSDFQNYSLEQLYDALESVDDVNYPGQLKAIENRIDELEGNSKDKLEGLAGWLLVMMVIIILEPIITLLDSILNTLAIFTSGMWQALTSSLSETYHPLWAPVIISEILFECIMASFGGYTAYLFITRKKKFIGWYIGISLFSVFYFVLNSIAVKYILPDKVLFDSLTLNQYGVPVLVLVIWIPYLIISRRVKLTFVK